MNTMKTNFRHKKIQQNHAGKYIGKMNSIIEHTFRLFHKDFVNIVERFF